MGPQPCLEETATFGSEGLHARPAAEIVKIAKRYTAKIELVKGAKVAGARSSVKLLLLGVKPGETVTVRAEGEDADSAVKDLVTFITSSTDEPLPVPAVSAPAAPVPEPKPVRALEEERPAASERRLAGICGAGGAALGPVFLFFDPPVRIPTETLDSGAAEGASAELSRALSTLTEELKEISAANEAGAIVRALLEVACDPELQKGMFDRVRAGHHPIAAVHLAGEAVATDLAQLEDPTLRARAEDVRAVARRLIGILCGHPRMDPSRLKIPSIVVAPNLGPWDLARLPRENLLGIVTAEGGPTSHVSIIARSLGIPALVGVPFNPATLSSVSVIALDAGQGFAILDPTADEAALIQRRIAALEQERHELAVYRTVRPLTRSGHPVTVAANLGSTAEIEGAVSVGAMGVGLFRTELLFMEGGTLPDEARQTALYGALAAAFPKDRVIIRTVDIGGDKIIPGVVDATETNPFLGWRGIRMCLDRPDLFRPQLRAILRAAVRGNVDVMFPMISDLAEVERGKSLLEECRRELEVLGVAVGRPRVGIMIETPAAALCARELARAVDFFSIGTNDLTQYVMAVDRMNPRLGHLYRTDHPAVLSMLEMTCRAARDAGIPVAVCGEAASDPSLIPALVKMGVDELSMSPPAIPRAKRLVTQCA